MSQTELKLSGWGKNFIKINIFVLTISIYQFILDTNVFESLKKKLFSVLKKSIQNLQGHKKIQFPFSFET